MPPGVEDRCSIVPATLLTPQELKEASRQPQMVSQVRPVYPAGPVERRDEGTISFAAELTEHGTVINPKNTVNADETGQLVLAAQMATGLWRFRPPVKDGCPARMPVNISHKFTLRK